MSSSTLVLVTGVVVALALQSTLGRAVYDRHLATSPSERPLLSVVSVAECRAIAQHNEWGSKRRDALEELFLAFTVVSISPSSPVVSRYADLYSHLRKQGRHFEKNQNDLWIAALAASSSGLLLTTDFDLRPLAPTFFGIEVYHPITGALVAS